MTVNPAGGSGAKEARDSACTPKWLAELIGTVDLDPCSNPRSHIQARVRLSLEAGDDGLAPDILAGHRVPAWEMRVFCNPPYARGQVPRWVAHYKHTRFVFLLRWDPSTRWFGLLLKECTHVWFPRERINFEPPPGVTFSSNPFPHALYLRDPPGDLIERLSSAGYLFAVDRGMLTSQAGRHAASNRTGNGKGPNRGAGTGGGERAPDLLARGSRRGIRTSAGEGGWGRFHDWLQAVTPALEAIPYRSVDRGRAEAAGEGAGIGG